MNGHTLIDFTTQLRGPELVKPDPFAVAEVRMAVAAHINRLNERNVLRELSANERAIDAELAGIE